MELFTFRSHDYHVSGLATFVPYIMVIIVCRTVPTLECCWIWAGLVEMVAGAVATSWSIVTVTLKVTRLRAFKAPERFRAHIKWPSSRRKHGIFETRRSTELARDTRAEKQD